MFVRRFVALTGPYVVTALLAVGLLILTLRLWEADPRAPLRNDGDAIVSQLWVKNFLETGWYARTDRAGAPYGLELYDFPGAESLHLGLHGLIALGCKNIYRVVNYYYFLTYILAALSALFAFRQAGLRTLPGIVGALLYAFLPYHFWRGEAHLFLSGYFLLPPTLLLALWLFRGELPGKPGEPGRARRWIIALTVAVLASSAGVYYAFFGCFFLLAGGIATLCRDRRAGALGAACLLSGVTTAGLLLNIAPSIIYARQNGPNPAVAQRLAIEADVYGLNLSQLLLPRASHRLAVLNDARQRYTNTPGRPLVNDFGSSLGVVGVVGLIAVVVGALFRRPRPGEPDLLGPPGALALIGALLGTIAGLGSLFAFFVSPQIRCYDRLSVCIAFFALFGVVVLLDRLLAACRTPRQHALGWAACLAVLAVGIYDQTSPADVPPHQALRAEYRSLALFTAAVEQSVPPGAMVLQLPYSIFPESAGVHQMSSYDHFRLLMHARTLRFSHGAVHGRYAADRLALLAALPPAELVEQATLMGYAGIHIDRLGYADRGSDLEVKLRALLGVEPLLADNGRDLFFPLTQHQARLREGYTPESWHEAETRARYPVRATWPAPFDGEERSPTATWRWVRGAKASLVLENPAPEPAEVRVTFTVRTLQPEPSTLTVSGLTDHKVAVPGAATVSLTVVVPPGKHPLTLSTDAPVFQAPGRDLWFGVMDFRLEDQPSKPPQAARAGR